MSKGELAEWVGQATVDDRRFCVDMRLSRSVEEDGDVEEFAVALNLENEGSGGRIGFDGLLEALESGHGLVVETADHVAGKKRNIGARAAGASGDDDAIRIAKAANERSGLLIDFDAENAETGDEILVGVGKGTELVEVLRFLGGLHLKGFVLVATLDLDGDLVGGVAQEELVVDGRKIVDGLAVDGDKDVADHESSSFGGPAGLNIGDDDAVIARQSEAGGHRGSDGLDANADFLATKMTKLLELAKDGADGGAGNSEAEAFVAAGLRKDEGVHADDFAVHVDERAARITGVDGGVGLEVDQRRIGIKLTRDRGDDAMGDGIAETFGAAEGENGVALADVAICGEGKGGELGTVNLEESEIFFPGDADDLCGQYFNAGRERRGERTVGLRRREDDLDALCAIDDVGVGDDVAVGFNDEAGANGALASENDCGAATVGILEGRVGGDDDLDDAGGDLLDEVIHGGVEGGGGGGLRECGAGEERKKEERCDAARAKDTSTKDRCNGHGRLLGCLEKRRGV